MKNTVEITTIKHKTVHGKELIYLKITHNNKEVLINIGLKTLQKIQELQHTK